MTIGATIPVRQSSRVDPRRHYAVAQSCPHRRRAGRKNRLSVEIGKSLSRGRGFTQRTFSLDSSVRGEPVTGIENSFLRGMQSSARSSMLTSVVSSKECGMRGSTDHSSSIEASIGGSAFAMFHLTYLSCFLTILSDNTARARILDRASYRNCQRSDLLCDWIANITVTSLFQQTCCASTYTRCIRTQHVVVARETEHISRNQSEADTATEAARSSYLVTVTDTINRPDNKHRIVREQWERIG